LCHAEHIAFCCCFSFRERAGVRGHSHRPARGSGRPSIDVWCNLPARLTPAFRRIRLHTFAERQAAGGREKKTGKSVRVRGAPS
jgi:hypothetical protein